MGISIREPNLRTRGRRALSVKESASRKQNMDALKGLKIAGFRLSRKTTSTEAWSRFGRGYVHMSIGSLRFFLHGSQCIDGFTGLERTR
jgi:hypothetical protein